MFLKSYTQQANVKILFCFVFLLKGGNPRMLQYTFQWPEIITTIPKPGCYMIIRTSTKKGWNRVWKVLIKERWH